MQTEPNFGCIDHRPALAAAGASPQSAQLATRADTAQIAREVSTAAI